MPKLSKGTVTVINKYLNFSKYVRTRVETGSGQLAHLSHLLLSSGSDPVYKISRSDPDSAFDHTYALIMESGHDHCMN